MSKRDAVQQAFDAFGRDAGFEKRSGSWYACSEEVIAVSNLQRSQYGPQYYFNQAFWLRALGDEQYPKPNKCHVRLRLEDLLPAEERHISKLLNMEWATTDEQRIVELRHLLDFKLLPLVERGSSIAGLGAMLDDGTLTGGPISGPARQLLASVEQE